MSSQLGRVGCEGRNVYNMNKFGVEGLARGMAYELAPYNIRVNTVCPTFVETPMVKKFFKNKKFKKRMLSNIPLGRVALISHVSISPAPDNCGSNGKSTLAVLFINCKSLGL